MTELLDQPQPPLTNAELRTHLEIEAARHTDPNSPDYVGFDAAPVHTANYEWLKDKVDAATEPLVKEENREHRFSTENLEEEFSEFSATVNDDFRTLHNAINNPEQAREVIKADYETHGGVPPDADDPNHLSFLEIADYLDALTTRIPEGEPDGDLHRASLKLVSTLTEHWVQRQEKSGENIRYDIYAPVELSKSPDGAPGVPSLGAHLIEQRGRFERVAGDKIHDLGEAVTNAAGVRQRILEHTETTTNAHTDSENISSDQLEGISKKAQEIKESALTWEQQNQLRTEQGALIPTIHAEGYESPANKRYEEIKDLFSRANFRTNDPQEINDLFSKLGLSGERVDSVIRSATDDKKDAESAIFTLAFGLDEFGNLDFGPLAVQTNGDRKSQSTKNHP